jgi:hypothetical protein
MRLQAVIFEAVITFGLVLLVLSMANGPKLNGPFTPIAVGFWIVAASMMGGAFEGASMNPARSFGPALATLHFADYWIYVVGPVLGAVAPGLPRGLVGQGSRIRPRRARRARRTGMNHSHVRPGTPPDLNQPGRHDGSNL